MVKVLYERDGRIARITLNRPEVLNAIDDDLPRVLRRGYDLATRSTGVKRRSLGLCSRRFPPTGSTRTLMNSPIAWLRCRRTS